MTEANEQLKDLADFLLNNYPNEIREGESTVDIAKRILSPDGSMNDAKGKIKSWDNDTLAKKELRRLAQYMLNTFPDNLREGGVVDNTISLLKRAYQ